MLAAATALLVGAAGTAAAQVQATQTLTFTVSEVAEIAASGSPSLTTPTTATAGSNPTSVTDNSASLALTANTLSGETRKVTVALDADMPAGVTLTLQAGNPTAGGAGVSGGTAAAPVTLTSSDQDLITGIEGVTDPSVPLTYVLSNTTAARVTGAQTRTVTFTLTAGAGGG